MEYLRDEIGAQERVRQDRPGEKEDPPRQMPGDVVVLRREILV
jgi:hypothetical protein